MKLIVFVGPRNSGKDTCASVVQGMGLAGDTVKFAGPLKDICSDTFGISRRIFEHPGEKEAAGEYQVGSFEIGCLVHLMSGYLPMNQKQERDFLRSFANHAGTVLNSPRQVLQYVGTEMIRAADYDWHCKAAFANIENLSDTMVVTDCRFLNEYSYLMEHHEPDFYYVDRPLAEVQLAAATHTSEKEIYLVRQEISKVIHNTGSAEDLHVVVRQIFGGVSG